MNAASIRHSQSTSRAARALAAGRVRLALWLMPCLALAIAGWGIGAESHNLSAVRGWTVLIAAVVAAVSLLIQHSDTIADLSQDAIAQALTSTAIACANGKHAQRVVSSLQRTGAAQAPARMRAKKVVATLGARALASLSLTPRIIGQRPLPQRG